MEDNVITLSEIIARGVVIEWHEGIAIVRAVIAHLGIDSESEPPLPELTQIDVSDTGTLVLVGGRKSSEPIRRLGQLVQAVLAHSQPPVQLRLLIGQATSPVPGFESVRALDEALAYYERPDRQTVLRTLYERASAMPPAVAASETTLDAIAPLPEPEPGQTVRVRTTSPRKGNRRRIQLVAVVVVLVASVVAAYEYATFTGRLGAASHPATAFRNASTKLGDAAMSGISAVTETLGLGRLVPASAPSGPPPPITPAPQKPRASRTAPVAPPHTEEDPALSMPPAPQPQPSRPQAATSVSEPRFTAYDLDLPPALVLEVRGSSGIVTVTETSTRVFSPDSPDVVPPVGLRPKLSRQLPSNRTLDQLTPVAILVGLDGSVETVKFLRPPRDVRVWMLLSVIKAWQFQPASREGVPVKYQKTVWVSPE